MHPPFRPGETCHSATTRWQARRLTALVRPSAYSATTGNASAPISIWIPPEPERQARGHIIEDLRIKSARFIGVVVEGSRFYHREQFRVRHRERWPRHRLRHVDNGERQTISGNTASRVTETGSASGIIAIGPAPLIERNRVCDLSGATSSGRVAQGAPRAIFQGNVVVNTPPGTNGIVQSRGDIACLDNVVTNFDTSLEGCTLDDGNRTF